MDRNIIDTFNIIMLAKSAHDMLIGVAYHMDKHYLKVFHNIAIYGFIWMDKVQRYINTCLNIISLVSMCHNLSVDHTLTMLY